MYGFGAAPANYYDNVLAFYALYYRSGIDDYLAAARILADRWISSPGIDWGSVLDGSSGGFALPGVTGRSLSYTGMLMRTLDGKPEYWPALRSLVDGFAGVPGYTSPYFVVTLAPIVDLRDDSYRLHATALCGYFDPDLNHRTACKSRLSYAMTNRWSVYREVAGNWVNLTDSGANSFGGGSSVCLTSGSPTVMGVGTNWTSDFVASNSYILFTTTPTSVTSGDHDYYLASFVSPTQLNLNVPYKGSTGCNRGWQMLPNTQSALFGEGTQPFMMGIASMAMEWTRRALAQDNYDIANSDLAESYITDGAVWMAEVGLILAERAPWYGRVYLNCEPPVIFDPQCDSGSISAARVLSAEAINITALAYQEHRLGIVKLAGDYLTAGMFAKLGTNIPPDSPPGDGIYASELETLDYNNLYSNKWFGLYFGITRVYSWPAIRTGVQPRLLR
jgi:hypothetical protein